MNLHLLEAPHAVQNVELLPAFREIDLPVDEVGVPQVNKGQVLENETPGWRRRPEKINDTVTSRCGPALDFLTEDFDFNTRAL